MSENSIVDSFRKTVSNFPNHAIHYLNENGEIDKQTYSDLAKEAEQLALGFQKAGMKKGNNVIIATQCNRQTVTSLWSCFFAGLVPTILQPPVSLDDKSQSAEKMLNVIKLLSNPLVISTKQINTNGIAEKTNFILYDNLQKADGKISIEINKSDLAFIQFSSGSTGDPKGIMLTHSNLISNIDSIIDGLQISSSDVTGNWMPLYHDMGLIGFHLTPLISGSDQYLIETIDFIKNPSLWLSMLSEGKVSITGSPNFGLSLVLRFLQRKKSDANWNFSSLKAMLNGAEPISVRIMNDFIKMLAPFGFAENAMMPVYGMAESTLAVSFTPLMQPSIINNFDSQLLDQKGIAKLSSSTSEGKKRLLASVGKPLINIEIRIVNLNNEPVEEGVVGHIQLRGEAMTKGYYKNTPATNELYCENWLRTGDLGFFLNQNLYISGRYKDIIFMNGKNYFANDLETLACSIDDFSYSKIAIGGHTDARTASEKIIVFAAGIPESRAKEVLNILRALFRKNLGLPIEELVLIRSIDFHKTSSGKIQRYKIMQRYIQGDFDNSRFK